jgi:hypothetical protein
MTYEIDVSGISFQFLAETRICFLHSVQTTSGDPNKLISIAFQDLIMSEISEFETNLTPEPSTEVTGALQRDT